MGVRVSTKTIPIIFKKLIVFGCVVHGVVESFLFRRVVVLSEWGSSPRCGVFEVEGRFSVGMLLGGGVEPPVRAGGVRRAGCGRGVGLH